MQIDPQVYIIGSGQLGFDMTDPFDCHVYLFDAGGTYVVFDAGTGMGNDHILDVCQRDGLDPANIDHLFLTHAHSDHGGGAAHLRERTNCTVYAGASTARIVTAGDEEAVSLPAAKAGGSYPEEYVYKPCSVEEIVEAGDEVEIGPLKIEVISTPGHSHDHHCYLVRTPDKRYLIGGDAIFFGGKIVLQNTYDCNVPETIASLQRLADYPFDALLPAHMNFSLNRGRRHIEAACEIIDRQGCPPSII
jgi:glyoxylase-like metal-dependent hydrolase (beta-lactamase superfamily II)